MAPYDSPTEVSKRVFYAGVLFAVVVTFAAIAGATYLVVYLASYVAVVEVARWQVAAFSAVLTVVTVAAALRSGNIRYEIRE